MARAPKTLTHEEVEALRVLLPKLANAHFLSKEQASKLSEVLETYDKYKTELSLIVARDNTTKVATAVKAQLWKTAGVILGAIVALMTVGQGLWNFISSLRVPK